jgi:TonB family protein
MVRWGTGLLAVAGMLSLASDLRAQDGYKIVNPANPITSASKAQVSMFFLERATWDDGQPVAAVDLPPTSPVREAFSRDILSMPVPAVVARWRNVSSVGRGDPPPSMATDREVLAYVRLKPGAIGYLSASTDTPGVKVISIGKADSPGLPREEVVEVGGAIPMPERIVNVAPDYPLIAKSGHVQGDVDIEVTIGPAGNIEKARVMRSIPMLDNSALAAVMKWKYKPTMINGMPVAVKTRVRVSFTL